jgi:hypothetical protein
MMPLSYNGFGFTAILIMVAVLVIGQAIRYLKDHSTSQHHKQEH